MEKVLKFDKIEVSMSVGNLIRYYEVSIYYKSKKYNASPAIDKINVIYIFDCTDVYINSILNL